MNRETQQENIPARKSDILQMLRDLSWRQPVTYLHNEVRSECG